MRAQFEDQGAAVDVLVDTGASAIVIDESYYDVLLGAYPDRPRLGDIPVDTVDGIQPGFLSRVWRIALLGDENTATMDDVPILVIPGSSLLAGLSQETGRFVPVLIGGTYLRLFRSVIDFQTRDLRLEPYTETPHIPTDEFVQPGLEISRGASEWLVAAVYVGSDAAAEGILEGDVLDTVDGMPVATLSASEVGFLVYAHPAGTEVRMGLRRPPGTVAEEKLVLVEDLLPSFPPPP
jgi:S1-C subfamily serine protease